MTLYVTPSGYPLSSENIDETGAIGNHGQRTVVVGGCISHEFRTKIRALNELAGAEQTHDYGYARVSTHGQSGDAQVRQLRSAGAGKVFREVASGAKTDRAQLRRLLTEFAAGGGVKRTPLAEPMPDQIASAMITLAGPASGIRSSGRQAACASHSCAASLP